MRIEPKVFGALALLGASLAGTSIYVRQRSRPPASVVAFPPARHVEYWHSVASEGHSTGLDSARVTIVEFLDFQCPACRAFDGTIRAVRESFPHEVRVVSRHFPLTSTHPRAHETALASECAAEQGGFDEFVLLAFALQDSLPKIDLADFGKRLGLRDEAAYARCLRDGRYESRVVADSEAAAAQGTRATPSFLVNDSLYIGRRTEVQLRDMIASRLNGKATR